MDIHLPVTKEQITTGGQRAEHTDPKIVLKEGQVVQAVVLAKQDQQVLLKVADLLVRAQTDGRPLMQLAQSLQLKVESFQADRVLLTALPKTGSDPVPQAQLPEVKISFHVTPAEHAGFSKLNITPGQTVAAKLITENQHTFLKIADQTIQVKPELTSFEGRNIQMLKGGDQSLVFIKNSTPAVPSTPVAPAPQQAAVAQLPATETLKSSVDLSLLKEMIQSGQVFQANSKHVIHPLSGKTELPAGSQTQPVQTVVLQSAPLNKSVSDQYVQSATTSKELPAELKMVKNMILQSDAKIGQPSLPAPVVRAGQELIVFDKVSLLSSSQLIEATVSSQKILLKPDIEFKDQIPLFLKYTKNGADNVLMVDPQSSKENKQLLQQLHFKLGQVIVEDENNAEIIKKIIDNKLPLTQENIKTIQNFIQASPMDAKTSIDLLINQNLLLGIFYQLNDINDKFLLKGMQKKNKKNRRQTDYEFTILYESEALGDILIEIIWSDHLKVNFYCADQEAYDAIIDSTDQLKEALTVKNIEIHAEVNKELAKKEPVQSDEIQLSNLDIKV